MTDIQIRLLGLPEWNVNALVPVQRLPPERTAQVLTFVAWSGQWVTREQLAELFWPDRTVADARSNVRKLLFRLRQRGLPEGMEDDGDALRCRAHTDVAYLLNASKLQLHEQVLASYGGPFLQGFDGDAGRRYSSWIVSQRQRFADLWREAVFASVPTSSLQRRRSLADALVDFNPLDEAAVLLLAETHRSLGQTNEGDMTIAHYERRLKSDFGIEPSSAFRQGGVPAHRRRDEKIVSVPVKGLPIALDAFVGRRQELLTLRALLTSPDSRWITLVGPGGIGKSRLLREALATVAPELSLITVWIPLAALHSGGEVIGHMAAAMDVPLPGQVQALQALIGAIGTRSMVIALDNAEHLQGWIPEAEALLGACPNLKLVVSSRQRLHASGEWMLPLTGLPQPDADSRDLDVAASFDAVVLFEQRARQSQPNFRLADHLNAVLDILAVVDGMPLAIELAASWTRVLPAAEIAEQLKNSPALLSGGPESIGFDAVFERSWAMLSPSEQRALVAVSVFGGSFGLMHAMAVTKLPPSLFAALVDKSMVQTTGDEAEAGAGLRLQLHPLIKHYARGKGELQELHALAIEHMTCYAAWITDQPILASGPGRVARISEEQPNLELALRTSVETRSASALRQLVEGVADLARRNGRLRPALAIFESLTAELATSDDPDVAAFRAPLLAAQADFRLRQGRFESAEHLARAGAREARRCGDSASLHRCINTLGFSLTQMGHTETALRIIESALPQVRRRHDDVMTGRVLNTLGTILYSLDRLDEATKVFNEYLDGATRREDANAQLVALNCLARVCFRRGAWTESLQIYERAVALAARIHASSSEQQFLKLNRALTLYELHDVSGCKQALTDLLNQLAAERQQIVETCALIGLGRVHIAERNAADARNLLRRAASLATEMRMVEAQVLCVLCYGELLAQEGADFKASEMLAFAVNHPALGGMDRRRSAAGLVRLDLSPIEIDWTQIKAATIPVETMIQRLLSD